MRKKILLPKTCDRLLHVGKHHPLVTVYKRALHELAHTPAKEFTGNYATKDSQLHFIEVSMLEQLYDRFRSDVRAIQRLTP